MIYVIAEEGDADGPVKIGVTEESLSNRLSGLQTGNWRPLVVVAMADGGRDEEAELHRRFAADRVHGEWFSRSAGVREYITANPSTHTKPPLRREPLTALLPMVKCTEHSGYPPPYGRHCLRPTEVAKRLSLPVATVRALVETHRIPHSRYRWRGTTKVALFVRDLDHWADAVAVTLYARGDALTAMLERKP